MKTRRLALRFDQPPHPVSRERARKLFAAMIRILEARFKKLPDTPITG